MMRKHLQLSTDTQHSDDNQDQGAHNSMITRDAGHTDQLHIQTLLILSVLVKTVLVIKTCVS